MGQTKGLLSTKTNDNNRFTHKIAMEMFDRVDVSFSFIVRMLAAQKYIEKIYFYEMYRIYTI